MSFLKLIVEFLFNIETFVRLLLLNKKTIFLLLTPQYLNYGDHAIALAEMKYLKAHFNDYCVVEINYSFYEYWGSFFEKHVRKDDIIVITGGGFVGNLWKDNNELTLSIVRKFRNRLVFAPQTVFFKKDVDFDKDRDYFRRTLQSHPDCFLFAREANSLKVLSELGFVEEKDYSLMPDFVLFLPDLTLKDKKDTKDKVVGICLRDDKEMVADQSAVLQYVKNETRFDKIKYIKMAVDHVEIPVWLRSLALTRMMGRYSECDLIITDRLHGMLLSAWCGVPCIAIDNVSRKVSGVYDWIKQLPYIAIIDNYTTIPEIMDKVMKYQNRKENRAAFFKNQELLSDMYLKKFDHCVRGKQR